MNTSSAIQDGAVERLSESKRALLQLRLNKNALSSGWAIAPRSSGGSAPLSFSQQRMWLMQQLDPANMVCNRPAHLRLRGPLDIAALRQAMAEIFRRHEVLRATFPENGGLLTQTVGPNIAHDIPLTDLSHLPTDRREALALRTAKEHGGAPFDLKMGPPMRARLLRLDERDHLLLITAHHIAFDAWSMSILKRELASLYEAFRAGRTSPLPPLALQYADFAVWQHKAIDGELLKKEMIYWKSKLGGELTMLELPTDHPRPAFSRGRGARLSRKLPPGLSAAIKNLAAAQGATLFMTMLAAFQALLWRYTGEDDMVIGTPVAGRFNAQLEAVIGCFINMLALRTDLGGDPSFRELLGRTREAALGAYENQHLPIERLVQEIRPHRNASGLPFFQVMFNYRNIPRTNASAVLPEQLQIEQFDAALDAVMLDLSLELTETNLGLKCTFEYDTELFQESTIERMLARFETLLASIVADPACSISRLALMDAAERQTILVDWNQTAADFSRDLCIHQHFEAWAAKTPHAVALRWTGGQLTYRQLNERADRLAAVLRAAGAGPGVCVGICMERSADMIAAILGVLKAGAAYLPLDPNHPRQRLDAIHSDARFRVLLTQRQFASKFSGADLQLIFADEIPVAPKTPDENRNSAKPSPTDLCYVLYTSGSTGLPKGVAIEHRALVNYIEGFRSRMNLSSSDSVLQFSVLTFDASAEEIFCALSSGATLVLRNDQMLGSVAGFLSECASLGVTVLPLPTAFFHELVMGLEGKIARLPEGIRLVPVGGDALLPQRLAQWKTIAGQSVRLLNLYGPTEATIAATIWDCDQWLRSDKPLPLRCPIGRPMPNVTAYVLDNQQQPVPIGIAGELYLGGEGLARGYLNRPDLTAQRFVPNPFDASGRTRLYRTGDLARFLTDGNLEFIGRADRQIKVRGFRIELGEIESALQQHPQIGEAIVLAWDEGGDKRLAAYVAPVPGTSLDENDVRDFLARKLPVYMLPSAVSILERFPLTPSGKLDRRALPKPAWTRHARDSSSSDLRDTIEEGLASIWSEVLGVDRVGIHEDFFELGGHSLLAVRMLSIVNETFGVSLPLASLFSGATIEQLGRLIQKDQPRGLAAPMVCLREGNGLPPLFFVHGDVAADGLYCRNLVRHLDQRQPLYVLHTLGADGGPLPERIEHMAAHYLKLICDFRPNGPYLLGGFCNGGLIAYEMSRQLRAQGREVGATVMVAAPAQRAKFRAVQRIVHGLGDFLGAPFQRQAAATLWVRRLYRQWNDPQQIGRNKLYRTLDDVATTFKNSIARIKSSASRAAAVSPGDAHMRAITPANMNRIFRHLGLAIAGYDPKPYHGRVLLLWPMEEPGWLRRGVIRGWKRVAKRLEVRLIPGNHMTCCTTHVQTLGRQLRGALQQPHRTAGEQN